MQYERRKTYSALKSTAQELRKNMTPEERKLWYEFLNSYPVRFRRQKTFGRYIADFYCAGAKIIVELDGAHHFSEDGQTYDRERDAYFASMSILVLRYPNEQIRNHFEKVCADISVHVEARMKKT
jgi:very-short-patch-repair endonuclease